MFEVVVKRDASLRRRRQFSPAGLEDSTRSEEERAMLRTNFPASRFLLALALSCFVLAVAGCGMPINESQYQRLKLGMTPTQVEEFSAREKPLDAAEVEKLLKENLPESADPAAPQIKPNPDDFRAVRWGTEKKNITVSSKTTSFFVHPTRVIILLKCRSSRAILLQAGWNVFKDGAAFPTIKAPG